MIWLSFLKRTNMLHMFWLTCSVDITTLTVDKLIADSPVVSDTRDNATKQRNLVKMRALITITNNINALFHSEI